MGETFDRWTVTGPVGRTPKRRFYYPCRCECGTVRNVERSSLLQGASRSCGCLRRVLNRGHQTIHGYSKARSPKYWRWVRLRQRGERRDFPTWQRETTAA